MGPESYMRPLVDRNVVMRRMNVNGSGKRAFLSMGVLREELGRRAPLLRALKDM